MSVPHVVEASKTADREAAAALGEAVDLARACREALDRADAIAAESGWLAELRATGIVWPWRPRKVSASPQAREAVLRLEAAFDEDAYRRTEAKERDVREREVEAKMKLPAGTTVWREGKSFVVGEDGELEEVGAEPGRVRATPQRPSAAPSAPGWTGGPRNERRAARP